MGLAKLTVTRCCCPEKDTEPPPPGEPCPPSALPCEIVGGSILGSENESVGIGSRRDNWSQVFIRFTVVNMEPLNEATPVPFFTDRAILVSIASGADITFRSVNFQGVYDNDSLNYPKPPAQSFLHPAWTFFPDTRGGASDDKQFELLFTRDRSGEPNDWFMDVSINAGGVQDSQRLRWLPVGATEGGCIIPTVNFQVSDTSGQPGSLEIDVRNINMMITPDQCQYNFSISYPDYTTPGHTTNPAFDWNLNSNYASPESVSVDRVGGEEPISYAKTAGDFPTGWDIDAGTGEISRPGAVLPVAGTGSFEITATDNVGATATATVTWEQLQA